MVGATVLASCAVGVAECRDAVDDSWLFYVGLGVGVAVLVVVVLALMRVFRSR